MSCNVHKPPWGINKDAEHPWRGDVLKFHSESSTTNSVFITKCLPAAASGECFYLSFLCFHVGGSGM